MHHGETWAPELASFLLWKDLMAQSSAPWVHQSNQSIHWLPKIAQYLCSKWFLSFFPHTLGLPSTGNHNWLDHCHKSVSQCNPWSPQHPNHPKPGLGPYSFKLHERGRKLFRVQRTSHVSAKGFKSQPTTANCMSLLHSKMHLADYPQKTAGQSPPDDHGMPRDPLRKLNSARTRHQRHHKPKMLWLIFEKDGLWGFTYGIGLFISSNTIKWSNTYYMLQPPITVYSPKKLWNHGGSVDPPTIQHPNPPKIRLHRPSWTPGMPSPRWWTW